MVPSTVAVRYTPTYLLYLLYSKYLFRNWLRTRLKPGPIQVIYYNTRPGSPRSVPDFFAGTNLFYVDTYYECGNS